MEAGPGGGALSEQDIKPAVRWPLLLYLGLVFTAPYLIWRLLVSLAPPQEQGQEAGLEGWVAGEGEHYLATVLHSFTPEREGELGLETGQEVRLAPRHLQPRLRGWLLAGAAGRTGLVPANYIQILGRAEGNAPAPQPDLVRGMDQVWQQ